MAANTVMFIGWNRIVPGREQAALALFAEALAFYGQQQQAGTIESFEPVLLAPHGGDLNGFILVHGDEEKLDELRMTDAYLSIETRAVYLLEEHGVVIGWTGDMLKRRLAIFQSTISA